MYGAAQTLLLSAFAGVYFLDRSTWLWPRGGLSGILGAAFCAAGLLLVVSAIVTLRRVIQIAPEPRQGGELVTQGVYSRFRHPIYTGIFLMVGGLALAFASPILAAWVVVAIFCASVRARAEEAMFVEDPVLGESYRDYLGHTGRFLPTGRKAQGTGKSPGDPGHP